MKEIMLADGSIENKIYTIRGMQAMLDEDLAVLYGVETRAFNQAVKRNIERFPERFRFRLTEEEYENLRSQNVIASYEQMHGGRRYLPYAFTEQGVSMLSAVLRSQTAIDVSIQIIDTFVAMRKFIHKNASLFQRLDTLEEKQLQHKLESDEKFDQIFRAIEKNEIKPKQHIFYDGQIFDAYLFACDIIKSAKSSIRITVYHFGASLKDLGKKWFAVSKMDIDTLALIGKIDLHAKAHP